MRDLSEIVARLAKARRDPEVPGGRIDLSPPASEAVHRNVREALGPAVYEHVKALLDVATGLSLHGTGRWKGADIMGFTFAPHDGLVPVLWPSVYPRALEFGAMDELLFWDVADGRPGPVFFVDHEGPYHWMRFKSFADCLDHFLTDPAPFETLAHGRPEIIAPPRIAEFGTEDATLRAFLCKFPDHYRVIDLRRGPHGRAFTYDGGNDMDLQFSRYGAERLWVQSKKLGFWERAFGSRAR